MIATPEEFRRIEELERENERLRQGVIEAINVLGPKDFSGELEGLIAEGNEALRVLKVTLASLTEEQNT